MCNWLANGWSSIPKEPLVEDNLTSRDWYDADIECDNLTNNIPVYGEGNQDSGQNNPGTTYEYKYQEGRN